MKNGVAPVNDGQLYFETLGDGEAIIFIHGFSLDRRLWRQQVEYFSKHNKVITYDMRGFGKSTTPMSLYGHHNDLYQLMKYLEIDEAYLVGLSLGGEIATDFTISYPHMVKKLILADASMHGYESTVDWQVHAQTVGLSVAKERWLNHQVFKTTSLSDNVQSELKTMITDYSGWHWLNHDPREKLSPPAFERLTEITCPTLIITGSQDLTYFQSIAEKYHHDITNSKKVFIDNAGHLVNMEEPELFNKMCNDFLESYKGN